MSKLLRLNSPSRAILLPSFRVKRVNQIEGTNENLFDIRSKRSSIKLDLTFFFFFAPKKFESFLRLPNYYYSVRIEISIYLFFRKEEGWCKWCNFTGRNENKFGINEKWRDTSLTFLTLEGYLLELDVQGTHTCPKIDRCTYTSKQILFRYESGSSRVAIEY